MNKTENSHGFRTLTGNSGREETRGVLPPFRMSMRIKLTLPVIIFSSIIGFLLFNTTFKLVRQLAVEKNTSRLLATTEVYAETIKVPLMLGATQDVKEVMAWMANRADVMEVRLEDARGRLIHSINPKVDFPFTVQNTHYSGVFMMTPDLYAAAVPLIVEGNRIGRIMVIYSHFGFDEELKDIFKERLMMFFVMMLVLAILTMGVTWLAIRPIFVLKRTVERILGGDLNARAKIRSFDEIEDLGEAFNEMVARTSTSLDRLRMRTEALEESEEKYRQIVESASDIIFTVSSDGELMLLNRGFSGYPREEFFRQGFVLFSLLNKEDSRKLFEDSLIEVCRTKLPSLNLALTHRHCQTQEDVFYLLNLTPVLDHDGHLKMLQGVMRDVTELRRVEMMKDSLIRDVTHELKTPVAKFQMTTTVLEKELERLELKDQFKPLLKIMKSNIVRLMDTITGVLDLSKLESGSVEIERVTFDLRDLLHQLCLDMDSIVREKGLDFETHFSEESLPVSGDKNMLYRLFMNLVSNAIKFTPKGKIALRAYKREGMVRVEIQDSGIGIQKEFLDSVFERFVQKTASSLGIGVGLTISRDIANLHNGRVWAESEGIDKGAIMIVELPPAG
ncbi:MAG: hypothetical protein COW12_04275 [Candidatus Omnitrophica bacterium CG12_big_fil_rev_8_21_14_0_65_45_16]|nr:MAG: hypothetical protein COW12_04275 [Candidatus Omnitrophica bacterium CG12_big_fil_rev_8_21_14_0_65_45_16]